MPAPWARRQLVHRRRAREVQRHRRLGPRALRERGGTLVVVDPRFSTAAGKARYWLPIKPGTDMALLLAWMNVIVRERLYDEEYVKAYGFGFEAFEAEVAPFTPEWAYPETGIEPAPRLLCSLEKPRLRTSSNSTNAARRFHQSVR